MFDLDISKLALIGAVALVVIGPEKMPRVARTIGTLIGKAQRYVSDVKAEVNRSMDMEDLKKMKETMDNTLSSVSKMCSMQPPSSTKVWPVWTWRVKQKMATSPSFPTNGHPRCRVISTLVKTGVSSARPRRSGTNLAKAFVPALCRVRQGLRVFARPLAWTTTDPLWLIPLAKIPTN